MDLHGTEEARTQEEGAEGPLDTYGGASGRSNERRDSHSHDTPSNVRPHRRRGPAAFEYPPGSGQTAVITERIPTPSRQAITIPRALNLTARDERLARKARRNPPVTKKTLSELDLACIMSNINLRMDANFDRDLHFKPDLGGEKGQRKLKEGKEYWQAIATEIATYQYYKENPTEPMYSSEESPLRTFEPRLPAMFIALDDIIKTLVPERDHELVTENLDMTLLMQEIRHGQLDMVSLSEWIAKLLKTHCAPLRDGMADEMVKLVTGGQEEADPLLIAEGLKTLFALLETMKLDVANHQIRTFRTLLIDDTVPFLKTYFKDKVATGELQITEDRDNYGEAASRMQREFEVNGDRLPINIEREGAWIYLFRYIGEMLAQPTNPPAFPNSFVFDEERLWGLRGSFQNLLNMRVAWHVLESYVNQQGGEVSRASLSFETFWSRIWPQVTPNEDYTCRPSSLLYEEETDLRAGVNWHCMFKEVALEVARLASETLGYTKDTKDLPPDEVYYSMEAALREHLRSESEVNARIRHFLEEDMVVAGLEMAHKFSTMSPLAIAEAEHMWFVQEVPPASLCLHGLDWPDLIKHEIVRISVRFAHIVVLHWRVWAPVLYNART